MRKGISIIGLVCILILSFAIFDAKAAAREKSEKPQKKNQNTDEKSAMPEKPETVYDLGNIVVKGEDGSSIKDTSKKRIAYLTKDSLVSGAASEKKTVAGFVPSGDVHSDPKCEGPVKNEKYTVESMAGNYSESRTTGIAEFEKSIPAERLKTKTTVKITGDESGGYRFKSDFRDLKAVVSYESEEECKNFTDAKLVISDATRSLPGFDAFPNNYIDSDIRGIKLSGGFSSPEGRFTVGFDNISRKIRIPSAALEDRYDASLFSLGYAKDLVCGNNPLTLELKASNDSLDIRSAQSSSDSSMVLSVNAERPVSDKVLVQITPEIAKNGGNTAKAGGSVSAVMKDGSNAKYTVTAGRQARKYDTATFLFPDENSLVWAQDGAGANRFAAGAFETDEKFTEIAAEASMPSGTKLKASYRGSKIDGLLYLTDLNSRDARFTFAQFANGASAGKFTLAAEHPLGPGYAADLSAKSTTVSDSTSGLAPYIPKYEYSLGLKYDGENGCRGRISGNVKEKMDTARTDAANVQVPSYTTVDLDLSKDFSENGKVMFRAGNLLNSELNLRPGYKFRGRSFAIGLGYSY